MAAIMVPHIKRVRHHGIAHTEIMDGEYDLQIWITAMDIANKQLRVVDKMCSSTQRV